MARPLGTSVVTLECDEACGHRWEVDAVKECGQWFVVDPEAEVCPVCKAGKLGGIEK